MIDSGGQPSKLKKEEWLKESPIYQNTVTCEKRFNPDFSIASGTESLHAGRAISMW